MSYFNFIKYKSLKISCIIFFSFCILVLLSCDKIKPPYTKKTSSNTPDTVKYEQRVLLEDFTGFKCGNCPYGHEKLDSLENIYGSKLIGIAIHAGYYAKPDQSGNFTTDFRTQAGTDLDNKFGITATGLPKGMVNRKDINNSRAIDPDDWSKEIEEITNIRAKVDLEITNSFNTSTLSLSSSIFIHSIDTISQPLVLSVFVVEDSIKDWQRDYTPTEHDIPNYLHRNVLRGAINGSFGEDLQNKALTKDQIILKTYHYTLNPEWKYKNVYIVAFVYNRNTNEVIQAQKARIF